jgi:hypothetical protein
LIEVEVVTMWLLSVSGCFKKASQTECQRDSAACQLLGMTIVIPNKVERRFLKNC